MTEDEEEKGSIHGRSWCAGLLEYQRFKDAAG